MSVAEATRASLLSRPHHDGSYVLEAPDELGGDAVVRLRVPRPMQLEAAGVRYVCDGQPQAVFAEIDEETESETWWRARFPVENPVVPYRWVLVEPDRRTSWLNALGTARGELSDDDDFVVGVAPGGPDWHLGSVAYQIFPDRFASSGLDVEPPGWAVRRDWDALPDGGRGSQYEWFGGDLLGIEQHLDHIESLGANLIYLTPIFPAETIHRYDATTFDRIDPLLGGDEALASLTATAHARGMRIVGDLTLNHVGSAHEWFQAALADTASPERAFFYFDESIDIGYVSWMGVPHLPKLNHASAELRRRLDEVTSKWARFGLDGWRIDVANMTGRYRAVDLNHQVARETRAALVGAKADAVLVAEHMHDARHDLAGDGWHGVMNYFGCLRPVWSWLREGMLEDKFWDLTTAALDGEEAAAGMTRFRAGIPWSSVLHSWPLLGSHDTPRLATAIRPLERRLVAIGMQMTMPGVPMLFAGDELGLEGAWGEDGRRTMPWGRRDPSDDALLDEYKRLIALRRSLPALARGGIRYAFVGPDTIAYLRETAGERLLCLATRAEDEPIRLSLRELGATGAECLYGADAEVRGDELTLPADGPAFHVWRLEA